MNEVTHMFRKNGKTKMIGEIHASSLGLPKERSERPDGITCDWDESDRCCEECGKLCWEAPWWDDSRANGGSCIGTQYRCGECDWIDSN